jgi:hypothetical protein
MERLVDAVHKTLAERMDAVHMKFPVP